MKSRNLMSNEFGDRYRVSVIVKKKMGNCWTTKTLSDARESVYLFFAESDHYRTKAHIYQDDVLIETITNPEMESEFKVRKKKKGGE